MEHRATTVMGFISIIKNLSKTEFFHPIADFRTVYRGHADKDYALLPSLFRDDNHLNNENLYLREFMRQLPEECANLSYFDILSKAQHFGVPTRLLDFTLNPLVSLFFACNSKPEKDGDVICITNCGLFYQDELTVHIIMNYIFRFKYGMYWNTRSANMLIDLINSKMDIPYNIDMNTIEKIFTAAVPIFIKPSLTNERVRIQKGVFALYMTPLNDSKKEFVKPDISSFFAQQKRSIIIPGNCKESIIRDLAMLGISEGSLFPNLDHGLKTIVSEIHETNRDLLK